MLILKVYKLSAAHIEHRDLIVKFVLSIYVKILISLVLGGN